MSDSILIRLRHHSKDERNTAFARSTMREAADELARVTAQRDAILMQARIWSGEAKAQKATVEAVGDILGGVPDWGPIAQGVEQLRAELAHYKDAATKLSAETYDLEAELTASRGREARMRGAAMLLRGRLLLENPNAVTDDADAALAEGAQG